MFRPARSRQIAIARESRARFENRMAGLIMLTLALLGAVAATGTTLSSQNAARAEALGAFHFEQAESQPAKAVRRVF